MAASWATDLYLCRHQTKVKRDEGALYPLAVHIPVVFLLIHVRILEILILEGHQFRVGNFKLSNADKKNASIPELEGMRSVLAELAYFSGALAVKGQQSLLVQGNLPPSRRADSAAAVDDTRKAPTCSSCSGCSRPPPPCHHCYAAAPTCCCICRWTIHPRGN